jgi:hypothetical protein
VARRVGEVLEAYLDPPRPEARLREVLVKVEPGARTAARLAIALVDRINAGGAAIALRPCDPAARALLGGWEGPPEGAARTRLWLATREPTPGHGCLLALHASPEGTTLARAGAPAGARALVGLRSDALAPLPPDWLAALSAHDALRIALGDRSGEALGRVAAAVGAWLAASSHRGSHPGRSIAIG